MDINTLEEKLGIANLSDAEKLALVKGIESNVQASKAAVKAQEAGQYASLVVDAIKRIKNDLETRFNELNGIIDVKAKSLKDGKDGLQGAKGEKGDRGFDGTNGKDGYNGKDGIDGVDGKDGVGVQDAYIDFDGSLIIKLTDGKELNVGEVVPMDVAEKIKVIGNGGGTSQSVLDSLESLQDQINTLTGIDGTLGTMAQQDATAVAITGGTINGATVGATTPAAGTFTTLTAQTARLNGTGQNFITYSQDYTNAAWTKTGVTVSAGATTAPDGTTTASRIYQSSVNSSTPGIRNTASNPAGSIFSIYVKADDASWVGVYVANTASTVQWFNVSTGAKGTTQGNVLSSSITSVGSGWYRLTVAYASSNLICSIFPCSGDNVFGTNAGTTGVYVWGAQVELASTAGTYIVTTSAAVYGTPTLSFSGVAGIGLESNGSLYHQPAGTGAVQAQATTSTATGGNARGANAVDWQTSRGAANQVASGQVSFVGGGFGNKATGYASIVTGGYGNTESNQGFVGGGSTNTQGGIYGAIVGGSQNTLGSNAYSSIIGAGYQNNAQGYFSSVLGGTINSTTSGSAVTTQSSTMNGTTAVTLSGSNGSIKVGQLVTGTYIPFPNCYVAAISGTSLTLSTAASGSGTATLSFYTPHGVVVGGGNNQATGSYSFIGGGGDAGTAGNRNVASGDWSFVGGGSKNTASGKGAVVCGGGDGTSTYSNNATNAGTFVGGGINNSATGLYAALVGGALNGAPNGYGFVGGGYQNSANADFSVVTGGTGGIARSIKGNFIVSSGFYPVGGNGTSQAAILVIGKQTTDATPTVLVADQSAAGTNNQVILPNNSAYFFKGEVIAGKTAGGDTKGWTIEGVIKRGANAASTTVVGVTVSSMYADAGAVTWTIAAAADTTNGGLKITATGQAATTIRWVCKIETTEMTY